MRGWGTPPEIALYVGRPLPVVRQWIKRRRVPTACDLTRGGAIVINAQAARQYAQQLAEAARALDDSANLYHT